MSSVFNSGHNSIKAAAGLSDNLSIEWTTEAAEDVTTASSANRYLDDIVDPYFIYHLTTSIVFAAFSLPLAWIILLTILANKHLYNKTINIFRVSLCIDFIVFVTFTIVAGLLLQFSFAEENSYISCETWKLTHACMRAIMVWDIALVAFYRFLIAWCNKVLMRCHQRVFEITSILLVKAIPLSMILSDGYEKSCTNSRTYWARYMYVLVLLLPFLIYVFGIFSLFVFIKRATTPMSRRFDQAWLRRQRCVLKVIVISLLLSAISLGPILIITAVGLEKGHNISISWNFSTVVQLTVLFLLLIFALIDEQLKQSVFAFTHLETTTFHQPANIHCRSMDLTTKPKSPQCRRVTFSLEEPSHLKNEDGDAREEIGSERFSASDSV